MYKRNEGKLFVLAKSQELYHYIIKMCKNEKIIPKRYYKILSVSLIHNSKNAMYSINFANNLDCENHEYQLRQKKQYEALNFVNNLFIDIDTVIHYFSENQQDCIKKFEILIQLVNETKRTLKKWIDSDFSKFSKYALL